MVGEVVDGYAERAIGSRLQFEFSGSIFFCEHPSLLYYLCLPPIELRVFYSSCKTTSSQFERGFHSCHFPPWNRNCPYYSILFAPSSCCLVISPLSLLFASMPLPSLISTRRQRKPAAQTPSSSSPESHEKSYGRPSQATVKKATRTRLIFSLLTSLLFLIALVFLILVEVGNTSSHHRVVGSVYFMKLDLSHIIPQAVPQATLINSIARTLGLHDFYQVGLWNYCEGYGNGITGCSKPKTLYWFNPVQIILSELLSGATSTSRLSLSPFTRLTGNR